MAWCLNFHAGYRCRHAGACCGAGWTIPFEDGTVAARTAAGACTFFEPGPRLCAIHRAEGPHALPLSCRMFPRIVLHDGRGTFISLSHFCPTAASLLFEAAAPAAIVEAPPALAGSGPLDGLDARAAWPPLLRPGVLMDLESYDEWERQAVALLTRAGTTPAEALAALAETTARITRWTPGSGALRETIDASFAAGGAAEGATGGDADRGSAAITRWLAARLFGSWTAYQADGLGATVNHLHSCLATYNRELSADGDAFEAVRRSDLTLLHRA